MTGYENFDALLVRVEQQVHQWGWDGAPDVWVLYDNEFPDAIEDRRILAMVMGTGPIQHNYLSAQRAIPRGLLEPYPTHALYRLALNVGDPDGLSKAMTIVGGTAGLSGIAMSYESWMSTTPPEDRAGRRLANIPGSREVRHVMAAHVDGTIRLVQRIRGEKPGIVEPNDGIGGSVPESLRRIAVALYGGDLPPVPVSPSTCDHRQARKAGAPVLPRPRRA